MRNRAPASYASISNRPNRGGLRFTQLLGGDMLTDDDLFALASQDMQTLAEGWCALNRWEWPQWLPSPETYEHRREVRETRAREAMRWIENRIGNRVISRVWNKEMTDEEHEDFWRGIIEGNADARERDHQRRLRKCGVVPSST